MNREWRVTYRRSDWQTGTSDQVRLFQSEPAARRFEARIARSRGEYGELSTATTQIESRTVGAWESAKTTHDRM